MDGGRGWGGGGVGGAAYIQDSILTIIRPVVIVLSRYKIPKTSHKVRPFCMLIF